MPPSDPADPVFDARLAELRSRFKVALGPRVERVAAAVAQIWPGHIPLADTEDLLTDVHSTAGAAAMFEMDEVNRAAAAIERLVLAIRSRTEATAEDIRDLHEACGRLEAIARAGA